MKMKAFEKWWSNQIVDNPSPGLHYKYPLTKSREVWKAALEWFLEEYAYEFDGHMWHIIEDIKEELNE
jgi:hypothetical protein